MGLIDEISTRRIHIEEKIRGIFLSIFLRGQGFITPCCFDHVQNRLKSLFFFRFSDRECTRAQASSSEAVKGEQRGRQPLPSLAFSHGHCYFQGVIITPLEG